MDLDEMFATIVGVLAALAVIGALVLLIVVEVVAIRHKLTAQRQPPPPHESAESFRRGRAVTVPSGRKWR
jgi:hypothetical protein